MWGSSSESLKFFSQWLLKSLNKKKPSGGNGCKLLDTWSHDSVFVLVKPFDQDKPVSYGGAVLEGPPSHPEGTWGRVATCQNPWVSPFSHSHEDRLLMVTRSFTKDVGCGSKNKHHKGTCLKDIIKTCCRIFLTTPLALVNMVGRTIALSSYYRRLGGVGNKIDRYYLELYHIYSRLIAYSTCDKVEWSIITDIIRMEWLVETE